MDIETILYQNNYFDIRNITLKEFGEVKIASVEFSNLLITEDGDYYSDEAQRIDEQIFYFVEPKQMEMSDIRLSQIITREVK